MSNDQKKFQCVFASFVYSGILMLSACAANNTTGIQHQNTPSVTISATNGTYQSETSNGLAAANKNQASEINNALQERWGVKVVGIRQSAAGYMLDFRYRVLDAEKATPLLDRRIKPELKVAKSGATLKVPVPPKIGALRQSAKFVKPDRNYFILFSNPGRHVIPGDMVSVVIGDFRAENLTVQ